MSDRGKLEAAMREAMGFAQRPWDDEPSAIVGIMAGILEDALESDPRTDVDYPGDEVARAEMEAAGIDVDGACERLGTTIETCAAIRNAGHAAGRAEMAGEVRAMVKACLDDAILDTKAAGLSPRELLERVERSEEFRVLLGKIPGVS